MIPPRFAVIAVACLAITALYVLFDPSPSPLSAVRQTSAARTLPLNINTPAPGVPPLAQVLKVMEGELVTLAVDSALTGEVVQHEQGLRVAVEAGKPTQARFRAGAAGRYPLQFLAADGTRHELGDLVIPPR